ncbi:hypothetical protein [Streptantibioticus ferralitis]|uniref:Uncharacterized protein n=1 Tax=Streptantibioticus ferralitis TaxID=236510 RepID=A0ABT5YU89_9ACTN|nr:hypothetical protein [Streptantibioticus ferralitis]MDF2254370.1 hypothetical protein [Streptantibioticus ferralitis]
MTRLVGTAAWLTIGEGGSARGRSIDVGLGLRRRFSLDWLPLVLVALPVFGRPRPNSGRAALVPLGEGIRLG